jgi:imidazolonepropionase-like amidohydrolase
LHCLNRRQGCGFNGDLTVAGELHRIPDKVQHNLPQALRTLVKTVGVGTEQALAMATSVPARLIGAQAGRLVPGGAADFSHLDDDWQLRQVWRRGVPLL